MTVASSAARKRHQGPGHWLRKLANVRVILPLAVCAGLLAYVINVAISPKSGGELWTIIRSTWWIILLLTIPYLFFRALVWRRLLEELKIEVPWRPMLVSFASGEITKSLPAGVYVENYLLARLEHFKQDVIARATMASTAMLGLEAAIAVPVCLILGWPGRPWARWSLLGVTVAWIIALALAWLLVRFGVRHLTERTPEWIRRVTRFIEQFLEAGGELVTWRTATNFLPTVLYLAVYAIDLYAITRALGIHTISIWDALAIYAFELLAVILIPIPTEIGLTEFTGLAALISFGVSQPMAAIVILGQRLMGTGMTIIVAGVILIIFRKQLSRAADGPADDESDNPSESSPHAVTSRIEESRS